MGVYTSTGEAWGTGRVIALNAAGLKAFGSRPHEGWRLKDLLSCPNLGRSRLVVRLSRHLEGVLLTSEVNRPCGMCDIQGKGDKGRRLVIEKVHTTTSPDFYLAVAFSLTRAVCCVLQLGEKAHKSAMTAGETCQWMVRHFHCLASQITPRH